MKIRWKLLILLLATALAPLLAASVVHALAARRLGYHLAADRREMLIAGARRRLHRLVEDYGRILQRDRQVIELAVTVQAAEAERRLAAAPPEGPRLFFADDFDAGAVPGLSPSAHHVRTGPDGRALRVPVSHDHQVCFLAGGADRRDPRIAADLARLSTMPRVYRRLRRAGPEMMYWQYTALGSGVHTSYPGHGGYPPDYDPRERPWYLQAAGAGRLTWLPPIRDASTRTVTLTAAMPVRTPGGRVAGVTGIDLPLTGIFEELSLPAEWAGSARKLLVVASGGGAAGAGPLRVLAQRSYQDAAGSWQVPVALAGLGSEDADELSALAADAAAGRSGVRTMRFEGRAALWAHGAGGGDRPFPVVVVPAGPIVAAAVAAERYVWGRVVRGLVISGAILGGVFVAVAGVALVTSRSVTRPVRELTAAAARLAAGDYDARVDVRTGDELQELAEAFNATGPKLAEGEKMRRALAVAMEIQQHLLPAGPPEIPGFDVAGRAVYCDETGGDYYDFIELVDLGAGKLGLAVGDVTGHGIAAALLMASARGVLRSHAGRRAADLSGLFADLNRHLVRDTGEERFMTLFYGVLDAGDRSLRWTSAGHDPALWLRAGAGSIEELPNTGIPLGILEAAAYEQAGPVTLDPGDVLVVGTDGIWEAADPDGEAFGKDRLRRVMTERAGASAAEIHAAVVDAVRSFRGAAPQTDDVTLIVIKAL